MQFLLSPTMSKYLFSMIITIFFVHPMFVSAQNVSESFQNCSQTFNCGNLTEIGYPFWGLTRPEYCGHPEFEINCTDQIANIKIDELSYRVLSINNVSKNLKVVREDHIGDICPEPHVNITLDREVLNLASDIRNVSLYYGCEVTSSIIPTSQYTTFSCNDTTNTTTGFFMVEDLGNTTVGNTCETKVLVQATESAILALEEINSRLLTLDDLLGALDQGFGLQWNVYNSFCDTCIGSGGVCGYNSSFTCYCSDGQRDPFSCGGTINTQTQPESDGKSKKVGLGVGLGIAAAVVVTVVLGWLLIIQKRKTKAAMKDIQTPSSPLIKGQAAPINNFYRTTRSYPSSKFDIEKGSTYFGTQVFSYEELVEATDNFNPSKVLGDGGFGTVYYGILNDGRVVAVKRLYDNNIKRAEQFMNEIEILTRLRHKNLVTLYGCTSRHSQELVLVYEYIPNGTVADHLHGNKTNSSLLTWRVRLSIAIETANALVYLHSSDVIHRDVKTTNILLDNNFRVKVADFGLSRLLPTDVTHVSTAPQGTPGYVDPEYYQCYQLTDKSDVYSFGVVLVELLSSLQAVDTNRHRLDINLANMAVTKIQNHLLNELVDPLLGFENNDEVRKMTTSVAELAFRCLQQERDIRPTMTEVLEGLKKIEFEYYGSEKVEVNDVKKDDVGILDGTPSFSPDSGHTDKWVSSSTTTTTATTSF